MMLDPKGLAAARSAYDKSAFAGAGGVEDAIAAYLSTVTPAEVGGLVERLRKRANTMNGAAVGASDGATYALGYYDQFAAADDRKAATTLEAQAAELAAKDAEISRLIYERDVWRSKSSMHSRQATEARAALAEARKALEPFARNVELIHPGAQDHDRLCDYGSQFNGTPTVGQARAARRALTGGQEDGQ